MKKLTSILLLLSLSNCALLQHPDKWSKEDKTREVTWLTLHTIDCGTTLDIADQQNKYYEINPLLGEHPSRSKVYKYMLVTAILHPIIVNYLPSKQRKWYQILSIGVSGACVVNNLNIGLTIAF